MTKRLEILVSLVEPCKTFADVGCDHGLVSKAVTKSGQAGKVYAGDISEKSLQKAIKNIDNGLIDRFFAFVSDGFKSMPDDIDEAMIAGMGGEEIVSVLECAPESLETIILQPMKNADKVRRFIIDECFYPDVDYTFYDKGKFYDVIRAKRIKPRDFLPYSADEIEFGRDNVQNKSDDFLRFLSDRLKEYSFALEKVKDREVKISLEKKISKIKELLSNENL